MSRTLVAAALQTHHSWDEAETVGRVLAMAEEAAKAGARLILPSELFAAPYFCKERNDPYFALARPADGHPLIAAFQELAKAHEVVVPCSFYEGSSSMLIFDDSLPLPDCGKGATMDAGKHNRSVTLLCPTCGGDRFEFEGSDGTVVSAKCASCRREFTKDELIDENAENISEHVKEMGQEITKDFAKEMRDTLKQALAGSKTIKFR